MRILQVHNRYLQAGGEDAVVETEAALLRGAGHEVQTFEVTNPDDAATAAVRLAAAPWNPRAAGRVRDAAARVRPDVAHVHNTWYSLTPATLAALRRAGIPVVMTLHNYRITCAAATLFRDGAPCTDCVGSHPWHGVRHRCYRDSRAQSAVAATTIALNRRRRTWHRDVDQFLALTSFGRDLYVEAGLPAERVAIKSNSTDDPGPRDVPPSASGVVVFVGRLAFEKGLAVLLDAWASSPSGLELQVVGDGPLRAELEARAPARVRFLGSLPKPEVTARLLAARALVLPSLWFEGQALVALEAAAAGLPVLHSRLGAMTKLFSPGADDLKFPPRDAHGLARQLGRLADDRWVDERGGFCRQRFEERHTHATALTTLQATYEAVRR